MEQGDLSNNINQTKAQYDANAGADRKPAADDSQGRWGGKIDARFDQLDDKKKGQIILAMGIIALLLGLYFIYRAISGLMS